MSADGRYVAFQSDAPNLVPDDTNNTCDVFVHDRMTGQTERVSVSSSGAQTIGAGQLLGSSKNPTMSADGRYVAFQSVAVNLVPGDTNAASDVFVRDRIKHTTTRLSVATGGAQGNGPSSQASISGDGRVVAFESDASNLVARDANGSGDVFVYDLRTHKTTLASAATTGGAGDSESRLPSISGNGRFVAFESTASDLTADGAVADSLCLCVARSIYRRDLLTGRTIIVSVASDGSPAKFGAAPSCVVAAHLIDVPDTVPQTVRDYMGLRYNVCDSHMPNDWGIRGQISGDGRYVVFVSNATNFVPNDTNATEDLFVHDATTGRTERITVDPYGHELASAQEQDTQHFVGGSISGDGRFVSYANFKLVSCNGDAQLVPGYLPGSCNMQSGEVSVYDRLAGTVDWISQSRTGGVVKPDGGNCGGGRDQYPGGFSRDGRFVSFFSSGQDLVAGDTNNQCDYFVRDRGPAVGTGAILQGSAGSTPPEQTCVGPVCLPPTSSSSGELRQATVVTRPSSRDLFVRWNVTSLEAVQGAPAGGLLYELRFTSARQRYSVRAERVAGPDYDLAGGASFGLFREAAPGVWTKVASLKGGYGTVGDAVVTAVPLSLLGGKTQLTDVTAYTAVGSYLSGRTKVLDSLRLSR